MSEGRLSPSKTSVGSQDLSVIRSKGTSLRTRERDESHRVFRNVEQLAWRREIRFKERKLISQNVL